MNQFKHKAMKELADQQVRFAPPARRQEQLVRAERLLAEIEPGKSYPYQFVCYRITDYRPTSYPDLVLPGEELRHDLYLFMAELSKSMPPVPIEEIDEPMLTLEQISEQLNVSTKTISRWRERGLVGRRIVCNGRRQLGFAKSTVERFLAANQERVERSSRFSQLTEAEKEEILRRARRMARVSGSTLTEISRRIARRLHRSPETIRYTIKNFDREHPEQALFPHLTGPLSAEDKQTIYASHRRGISVETLAKRFGRTRNSVYRVINEVRAQQLLSQPLEYIYHPSFDDPAMEADILAPMPHAEEYEQQARQMRVPKDAPPEMAALYQMPLLSKEQEQHLFRQMNFLKYRASLLRQALDPAKARAQDIKEIEELQEKAAAVKDLLIRANMRLVVSIAKRHASQADNLWELISDGNMSLLRAVEKFDFSRGYKFSTYASWAIMKNFARSIPEAKMRRDRYLTGNEEFFETAPDNRSNEQEIVQTQEQNKHRVNRLLEYLEPREREIIRLRAGLDSDSEMTLEEIGKRFGFTKERARQLSTRIMNKLRTIARERFQEWM
ncbi:MAG: sigma-70 family RNA polymerase sigma factor [Gemmataceae bacterium]|nr:sigma-70 family RNA polymerase sigma factor [Gemmataceae bacterium]MDW8263967.1 sigma-70 family RNA polymerase sigma factor [Gemmataceae bacterium]